jgi:hypothetical protein
MKIAFLHYHLKPGGVTTVSQKPIYTIGELYKKVTLAESHPKAHLFVKITTFLQIHEIFED